MRRHRWRRAFRVRRGAKAARARSGTAFRSRLSEAARVTVTIQRAGSRGRYKALRTFAGRGTAGRNRLAFRVVR